MAVTITSSTLSTNAKYLTYGASTAAEDAAEHCKKITDTLISLGWSRFDTAGETAVLGTTSNATRVLRRATYDNASSGNYQYLGITVSWDGTASYYTLRLTGAAGWSDAASATAFVNPVRLPYGTESSNWKSDASGIYIDNKLNALGGGTLWIFNDTHGTVFVFTAGTQLNDGTNVYYVGEYNKTFGEHAANSSSYLHNGIMFNGAELSGNSGAPWGSTPSLALWSYRSSSSPGLTPITEVEYNARLPLVQRSSAPALDAYSDGEATGYVAPTQVASHVMKAGETRPQFVLTEYPTSTNTTSLFGRNIESTPESWDNSYIGTSNNQLATRMHFGWLGWVGHNGPMSYSLASYTDGTNSHFGHGHDVYDSDKTDFLSRLSGKSIDSYSNDYVIYEPSISVGHTGRPAGRNHSMSFSYTVSGYRPLTYAQGISYAATTSTYAGTAVKFSVFGKMYGIKMGIGFATDQLGFLDTATIPVDANGFYSATGTDTDHWAIPLQYGGNSVLWVKK